MRWKFPNMSDAELKAEIERIEALPEDECHPDDAARHDEMVAAYNLRMADT